MSDKPDYERLKLVVDVWKHTVSVQMHFNDMEMKVRNLYFTILAASIGLIGAVQGKRIEIPDFDLKVSLSIVVIAAVVPISALFYFIDRHWYHRLLKGAVNQCMEIEKKYEQELPEIQLGSKISAESRVHFPCWIYKVMFLFVRDKRFRQDSWLHSDHKIEVLYKPVMLAAVFIVVIYGGFVSIRVHDVPVIHYVYHSLIGTKAVGEPTNVLNTDRPSSLEPINKMVVPNHKK